MSLSSIRELERGLEASLSDKTMMSGEGVSLPRSGSLRRKEKIKVCPTVKVHRKVFKTLRDLRSVTIHAGEDRELKCRIKKTLK